MVEMEIPITVKCPHCGKEAVRIVIPLPIDKIGEIVKNLKK